MSRRPAAWKPPAVMPALGEGEAVRSWPIEVWGAPAAHPPASAPGFQAAWRLGLLPPPPPPVPPSPLPGLSSWDRMRLGLLLALGVFAVMIPVGNALDAGAFSALLAGAPFCAGVWLLYSTRARDEVEFAAGYTSGQAHTGLWRLARDGRVLRASRMVGASSGLVPLAVLPRLAAALGRPGLETVAPTLVVARAPILPRPRTALPVVASPQRRDSRQERMAALAAACRASLPTAAPAEVTSRPSTRQRL